MRKALASNSQMLITFSVYSQRVVPNLVASELPRLRKIEFGQRERCYPRFSGPMLWRLFQKNSRLPVATLAYWSIDIKIA
jgi:hypothetical protein